MSLNTFWGSVRTPGRAGKLVRIGLAVFAVVGSLALGWSLLNGHTGARAAGIIRTPTQTNPWGIAIDQAGGHVWVAEPACDSSPVCAAPPQGAIGEYNLLNDTLVHTYSSPGSTIYTPVFVALDGSGNIWFTDPTHNSIGELIPGSNTWQEWGVPTASAEPYDLVFSGGNLWFSEMSGNAIGFFNITSHTFVENKTPTATSHPYGITVAPNGDIWFAENVQALLGSFTPTANGVLGVSGIHEHPITHNSPHLIVADHNGNMWFSEAFTGNVGELTTSGTDKEFNVCDTSCANGTHISGIAVDGNNNIWFDDSLSQRVGVINQANGTFTAISLATTGDTAPHTHDGLVVDANNNVWVSEQNGFHLDELPPGTVIPPVGSPTPGTSPTSGATVTPTTPTGTAPPGPVAKTWYFAEGRVGKGFNEYLTISNPSAVACSVDITYMYTLDNSATPLTKVIKAVPIPASSRWTEHVNQDLNIDSTAPSGASLASVVTMNAASTCAGVVAERPLYFANFQNTGISSGNDVVGSTTLNTTYDFADIPNDANNISYISILNPSSSAAATVTATYYANGKQVGTQNTSVPVGGRGTIPVGANMKPALPSHVVAVVTSTIPVVVERPTYFKNGPLSTSGGYDVIGAQSPAKDWFFAEGYTGSSSGNVTQENLTIANLSTTATENITITLKSKTGITHAFPITLGPLSSTVWNVNANNTFVGSSPEVSSEVLATGANIVVQREMYFHYNHNVQGYQQVQASGGDDIMGIVGPITRSSYSFSEGYTALGYNEWLTVQNPNATAETIYITMNNTKGQTVTFTEQMPANSRLTVDITQQAVNYFKVRGDDTQANAISMTVQTLDGHPIVAERPEYWHTATTQGGSDVAGYTG